MTLLDVVRSSTRLRPATRAAYATSILQFETFARGRPLSGALVEAWRDARMAAGISATTVHRDLAAVRFASRRAAALGLASNDFAVAAELPPLAPWSPRQALSPAEYARMEDACLRDPSPVGRRDLALFRVSARLCGARRSELAGLAVGDYRPPAVTVSRKGGWRQTLTVDSATAEAVQAWLAWRGGGPADPMFVSLSWSISDEWMRGAGLSASGIAHVVAGRAKQASIRRRVTPHLLRHTFISFALAAGVPAHRVMVAAGHRSLDTTSRYISDVQREVAPVGDAIAQIVSGRQARR